MSAADTWSPSCDHPQCECDYQCERLDKYLEAKRKIDTERVAALASEYSGYHSELKASRVGGTLTVGEFVGLLSIAAETLEAREIGKSIVRDDVSCCEQPFSRCRGLMDDLNAERATVADPAGRLLGGHEIVPLTHPELEEALKSVGAYDSAQIGMLDSTLLWRLKVAGRQYVWMLQCLEKLQAKHSALLKALRKPTPAMLEAAFKALDGSQPLRGRSRDVNAQKMRIRFAAMIAVLLAEQSS